jgi:hypothetical protein
MGDHIDKDNLTVTSSSRPRDSLMPTADGVTIVVTKAYGPAGDSLVGLSDVTFDGHPAVTLKVRAGEREGLVHLSPIHGDRRKLGMEGLAVGSRCELLTPFTRKPLDLVSDDASGGFAAIYLTKRLAAGEAVLISPVWGRFASRILHDAELISAWDANDEEALA